MDGARVHDRRRLVLGAVIAPTDAVSAVAVGQKLGLPKRVIAILTGEGLVNDATALTLFTVAVAAVTGTRIATDSPLLFFAYEVIGGVVVGLVLAFVVKFVRARMYDSPLETGLGWCFRSLPTWPPKNYTRPVFWPLWSLVW